MVQTRALLVLLGCSAASALSVSEGWPWSRKTKTTAAPKVEEQVTTTAPMKLSEKKPALPGCYMRMLSGCPKKPMRSFLWRRDTWAEEHALDKEGCEARKSVWDTYCDARDAQMVFVPKPEPPKVEEVTTNETAPAEAEAAAAAPADNQTETQTVSNETASEPLSALQISAEWQWPWSKKKTVVEAAPTEAPAAAKEAEAETTQAPAAATEEATVKDPTQSGCYMRMPSGCPKKPMKTALWRHDTWAEQHELDEAACQQRKSVWDGYCESTDAKMIFVPKQQ